MASQVESIKWVPNTRFIVDGFKYQSPACKHYFLSHYHSDHTIGVLILPCRYCISYSFDVLSQCGSSVGDSTEVSETSEDHLTYFFPGT
jgi:ribonuclease BN (tRNA processing enzyme)